MRIRLSLSLFLFLFFFLCFLNGLHLIAKQIAPDVEILMIKLNYDTHTQTKIVHKMCICK